MAQITDGTTNTLLFGEKWMRPDQYNYGAWNDDHNLLSSLDPDTMRIGLYAAGPGYGQEPDHGRHGFGQRQQSVLRLVARSADAQPSPRLGSRFGGGHPSTTMRR